MGSLSIWHWIVVIAVVLLLFGRGKISDLMGDVAQGIKAFKKGMQDDDKTAEKPEPVKTHRSQRRAAHGGAVGRRQQGCLTVMRCAAARLSARRGRRQILLQGSGRSASRERNFSCSTSGGVNWSSSRLSR